MPVFVNPNMYKIHKGYFIINTKYSLERSLNE